MSIGLVLFGIGGAACILFLGAYRVYLQWVFAHARGSKQ